MPTYDLSDIQDPGESDKCMNLAIKEFREGQHMFEFRVSKHMYG